MIYGITTTLQVVLFCTLCVIIPQVVAWGPGIIEGEHDHCPFSTTLPDKEVYDACPEHNYIQICDKKGQGSVWTGFSYASSIVIPMDSYKPFGLTLKYLSASIKHGKHGHCRDVWDGVKSMTYEMKSLVAGHNKQVSHKGTFEIQHEHYSDSVDITDALSQEQLDLLDYGALISFEIKRKCPGKKSKLNCYCSGVLLVDVEFEYNTVCLLGDQPGHQGKHGPQGERGNTGASGPQGPRGERGFPGEPGIQGPEGPEGPVGTGLKGMPGKAGPAGPTGVQGPTGVGGPIGPDGPQGAEGPTGNPGERGPTGTHGQRGASGFRGAPGVTGVVGPEGTRGPEGPAGPEGPQGPDSDTPGPQGPEGFPGIPGNGGIQGPEGPPGTRGNTGRVGPPGFKGTTGPRGTSGPKGTKGVSGNTGPEGPEGRTGSQGPRGPTGDEGPQGDRYKYPCYTVGESVDCRRTLQAASAQKPQNPDSYQGVVVNSACGGHELIMGLDCYFSSSHSCQDHIDVKTSPIRGVLNHDANRGDCSIQSCLFPRYPFKDVFLCAKAICFDKPWQS